MVFNIASAGLVWTAYQQNGTLVNDISTVSVTYTEYALSITEMVFIILGWLGLFQLAKKEHVVFSLTLLTVQAFNIAYSAYVIEYYNSSSLLPMRIINMALAIIILNCLALCGCCIGVHTVLKDENASGGGGGAFTSGSSVGGRWTLSQV
jgi:hypothetical protein